MSVGKIPQPTTQLVHSYLDKWKHKEIYQKYRAHETSLKRLFHTYCPENKSLADILIKVSALNDFYGTNIYDTFSVAQHVAALQIDDRLTKHDLTLVNDLAQIVIKGKKRNFYSFASKYCSHHQPRFYPIYDYFVHRMLMHYQRADKFHSAFKQSDLQNYRFFYDIMQRFRKTYDLSNCTLREIDWFLWMAGRKYFPKKY